MKILETICQKKTQEITFNKSTYPIEKLQKSKHFNSKCYSLKDSLKNENGIIAEFKRKSPSKGIINARADVNEITSGYEQNGASAISVLTDTCFFGALEKDFEEARSSVKIPLLRKDFIIDEYQIFETKAMGADIVLLIARILTVEKAKTLCSIAKQLGMEVLLEVHASNEIEQFLEIEPDFIGVNNRNLNSFEVNIENSIQLAKLIPNNIIKIAESGIENTTIMKTFIENGFQGFLIGEFFMKHEKPFEKCGEFINFLSNHSTTKSAIK